jgi:hypothetical protein
VGVVTGPLRPVPDRTVVDEDAFQLACRVVNYWRKGTDGSDPQLIDLIAQLVGVERARVETLEHQAGSLQRLAEELEPRALAAEAERDRAREIIRRLLVDHPDELVCDPWTGTCSCSVWAAKREIGMESP